MTDKRNQPCSCGSGKRYKKCCGLPGINGAATADRATHRNLVLTADEYCSQGDAAISRNQLEEAAGYFRQALKLQPDSIDALNRLGVIQLTLAKPKEAAAAFSKMVELQPDNPEPYFNLGIALYDQGKLNEAVTIFRRVIELKPDYVAAHYNLGNFFMEQGKLDEAIESFNKAMELKPDYAEASCNLGLLYKELGQTDDAVASFKKSLSLKPDYVRAYKGLSLIVKYTEENHITKTMESLYARKGISGVDRKDLGFALGKTFEDLGDYEKSFDYILEANRLKRKSYNYSIQNDYDLFARIKEVFSPEFFAAHPNSGFKDKTPIFILGMPRSGTTLVEQILASHSQVYGAGELGVLIELTGSLCAGEERGVFPECVLHLGETALAKIGSGYIDKIRKYSPDADFITDKLPHNFLRVGLIKIILPNAKVIHCVRNPMDTCLSIFKMDFTTPHGYAYDMVELGQYFNLYRDLMAHWEKVLPGFMHTIKYEDLVSDQHDKTKNLLDFCGLPWDEACLFFHKTERRVSTASLAQVRQPIYQDSVELWKRYEKQLEPLSRAIYGP